MDNNTSFDEGWYAGYSDAYPLNPYTPDTDDWYEWNLGYDQGSRDC